MDPTIQEEAVIFAALAAVLPGWRLRGAMPSAAEMPAGAPEAAVLATGWQPPTNDIGQGGGARLWTVRLATDPLRPPAAGRIGDGVPAGLLPAAGLVRRTLAGLDSGTHAGPLVPLGGAPAGPGVWEERFAVHPPALGCIPGALATAVVSAGVLLGDVPAGSTTLLLASVPTSGALLALEHAGSLDFLGTAVPLPGGAVTVERPTSRDFPAGANVWQLPGAVRLPALPATGPTDTLDPGRRVDTDLAGGHHVTQLAAPRWRLVRCFGPVGLATIEQFLQTPLLQPGPAAFLLAEHDGRIWHAHLAEGAQVRTLGFGLAALHLVFSAMPLSALAPFEEPAP